MFFQNVLDQEFRGTLLGSDRQYTMNFNLGANTNRTDLMVAWNPEPYDFSVYPIFTINYSLDFNLPNFPFIDVNVVGINPNTTAAHEVATRLNSDTLFAPLFEAGVQEMSNKKHVYIRSKRPKSVMRIFVSNSSAERSLKFNKKAPVGELPSYFRKWSLQEAAVHPTLGGTLLALDGSNPDDAQVITAAGFDPTNPKKDWQLLAGRTDAFTFKKKAYASGVISSMIIYPAGAQVGDLAKKVVYDYTGSDLVGEMEIPYILTSGDMISPP